MTGQFDGLCGGIGAGTRDDRHTAIDLVDTPFDHLLVLVMRQSRTFPRGSHRNQAIRALRDLPFDDVAKRFFVERAVFERRDQRCKRASKARLGGHDTTSPQKAGLSPIDIGSESAKKALAATDRLELGMRHRVFAHLAAYNAGG